MSTVPVHMYDIVRVTATGHESTVHGLGPGTVLLRFDQEYKRVPRDEVEVVLPAMAVVAMRDEKFKTWFDTQIKAAWKEGYDMGLHTGTADWP